jgi:hypothetical protein
MNAAVSHEIVSSEPRKRRPSLAAGAALDPGGQFMGRRTTGLGIAERQTRPREVGRRRVDRPSVDMPRGHGA